MKTALAGIVTVLTLVVTGTSAADVADGTAAPSVAKESYAAKEAPPPPAAKEAPAVTVKEAAPVAKPAAVAFVATTPVNATAAKEAAAKEAAAKEAAAKEAAAREAAAKEATAAPEPAPAVAPAPAAPAALEGLPLRPAKAITLAQEQGPTPWYYKLVFVAAIAAAGVFVWRKRKTLAKPASPRTALRVIGRTAMGLRGELAVVEVGTMRLLVGITPASMQTLAILEQDIDEATEEANAQEALARAEASASEPAAPSKKPANEIGARARALFGHLDLGPPAPPARSTGRAALAAARYADERDVEAVPESAPAPPKERTREKRRRAPRDVEGQARGLALALGSKR